MPIAHLGIRGERHPASHLGHATSLFTQVVNGHLSRHTISRSPKGDSLSTASTSQANSQPQIDGGSGISGSRPTAWNAELHSHRRRPTIEEAVAAVVMAPFDHSSAATPTAEAQRVIACPQRQHHKPIHSPRSTAAVGSAARGRQRGMQSCIAIEGGPQSKRQWQRWWRRRL